MLLGLTACGNVEEDRGIALTNQEVCDLISDATAQQVLGGPVDRISSTKPELRSGSCSFHSQEKDGIFTKNFVIAIASSNLETDILSGYNQAIQIWENLEKSQRTSRTIDNLGTAAYWSYAAKSPQLYTHNKNHLIIITLGQLDTDEQTQLALARSLAEEVFTKL